MNIRKLGVLGLADPYEAPPAPPGFDEAQWFGYPLLWELVPNAWARDVVGGNVDLTAAYVESARTLERSGASAITANCGYAIAYQAAVQAAVSVPVGLSSLLQLPSLARELPPGGRIGLLCFDATRLNAGHLRAAGLIEEIPLAIGGIQGTTSWKNWIAESTTTDWDALRIDVMGAMRRLWRAHPEISHWLLECAGFPGLSRDIAAETGRPVRDWVTLCDGLMADARRA